MSDIALIDALCAIVGDGHVITGDADLAGYDCDGRGPAGRAAALVRPRSAEEVAAVIALAALQKIHVVPQGGRTGLVAGGVADDTGSMLLLSLERLVEPLEIDPINRTARVGAGVSLSRLNAAAAEHGLFFPVDLGADPTVGGMVSANTGGARFLRYGDVRRNTLALELVTSSPDAHVLQLGRDCWKQNDGMDLKQMAIGTGGGLGVVTAATLALQPRPVHSVSALIALTDAGAIGKLLVAFEQKLGMLLTAFEGMSAPAYAAALAHVPRLRRPFAANHPYFVLIELSAGPLIPCDQLEDMLVTAVAPFLEGGTPLVADVVVDHGGGLWALRHALTEGLRASGTVIGCDIALPRGDLATFRQEMIAELARDHPQISVCDFGHIGDGGLHFNLVWPHSAGAIPDGLADALRLRISTIVVERFGGCFSAEHGVGPRNILAYRTLTPLRVQRLAGCVQSLFAPLPIGRVEYGPTGS